MTHFTLLSYERALRLPTSFPISGLARLGVKPRLCRSFWRAFASTHRLMLPSTCSREALLACPPCSPWNLPLFTVESTLCLPCFHSDPLTLAKVRLSPTLTLLPHDLVLWTDDTVSFLFGKGGSGVPRHARFVLSRLRCDGHSLLLSFYLSRIGRIENSSCIACEHSSQDNSHLILHCPAMDSLRRSLFGDSLGSCRLLGLHGLPPCSHPSEGVG